ncbi:hypothetical protein A2U01_0111869, partial [Trifolium medium]|nr:hypothetical protein [Trifolium medium]
CRNICLNILSVTDVGTSGGTSVCSLSEFHKHFSMAT